MKLFPQEWSVGILPLSSLRHIHCMQLFSGGFPAFPCDHKAMSAVHVRAVNLMVSVPSRSLVESASLHGNPYAASFWGSGQQSITVLLRKLLRGREAVCKEQRYPSAGFWSWFARLALLSLPRGVCSQCFP